MGYKSSRLPIKCGVPQGSILGPLLFIIYLKDIAFSSKLFSFIIYADDTNLLASDENLTVLINSVNNELQKISSWFKANKLSLNVNKTNFMFFKNRHNTRVRYPDDIMIIIDDKPIKMGFHY